MKKSRSVIFLVSLFFILPFLCMVLSCDRRNQKIAGTWEDNERVISFEENSFTLSKKNASQVKAFRGTYSFAQNPEYALYLSYTDFLDQDGAWNSLEGTELFGYKETALFNVSGNKLSLKIIESGITYSLIRSSHK